jgi:hypothetical protein
LTTSVDEKNTKKKDKRKVSGLRVTLGPWGGQVGGGLQATHILLKVTREPPQMRLGVACGHPISPFLFYKINKFLSF